MLACQYHIPGERERERETDMVIFGGTVEDTIVYWRFWGLHPTTSGSYTINLPSVSYDYPQHVIPTHSRPARAIQNMVL